MSTPGTKTAAAITPFRREDVADQRRSHDRVAEHRQLGGERRAGVAEPPRDRGRDLVEREALAGRDAHEVGREHVRDASSASVTATIGMPRAVGRAQPASSAVADPDERRRAVDVLLDARRRGSPPARSSRASSGTSSRAPATASGRVSPAPRRSSRTSENARQRAELCS